MTETKVVSGGIATEWTDVSSGLSSGTKALIRIENNTENNPVSVYVRKKGDTTSPLPDRMLDWASVTLLVSIDSSWKFQYKTSGTPVDIYVISDYIVPTANYGSIAQVYEMSGLTVNEVANSMIAQGLQDSEEFLDNYFGRSFLNSQSVTEYFDTYDDWSQTIEGVQTGTLFLRYRPVQSISSMEEYDTNDTLVQSYTSDKYFLYEAIGQIVMRPSAISTLGVNTFVNQRKRVKIVYTYGYSSVPGWLKQLSNLLASVYALTYFHGLKWEAPSSVGLPNLSSSIGSIPQNVKGTIELLGARYDALIKSQGRMKDDIAII